MRLYAGTWDPAWGHTWVTRGFGKVYALRSLAEGAGLLVWEDEALTFVREYPLPGAHPCHMTLLGRQAVIADYTSGTLTLLPLSADGLPCGGPEVLRFTGAGPHPVRQTCPHIHSSWLSPDGGSLVVADLGTDHIYRFPVVDGRIVTGSMETFPMPPGCGPRHCAFGREVLYVATELSDEVLVLSWPEMLLQQRIVVNPLRPGGGGHLVLSPDGRFLYVSSRLKGDGIAVLSFGEGGLLVPAGYFPTGAHPRHFCLSPDGTLLLAACRDDDKIQLFDRSTVDGSLTPTGQEIAVSRPVFVEINNQ